MEYSQQSHSHHHRPSQFTPSSTKSVHTIIDLEVSQFFTGTTIKTDGGRSRSGISTGSCCSPVLARHHTYSGCRLPPRRQYFFGCRTRSSPFPIFSPLGTPCRTPCRALCRTRCRPPGVSRPLCWLPDPLQSQIFWGTS